eukprot:2090812-Amphidinium_carterae.1
MGFVRFEIGRHGIEGYFPAPGDENILDVFRTTYRCAEKHCISNSKRLEVGNCNHSKSVT